MEISILFHLSNSSVYISEGRKFVFTEHSALKGKLVNTEQERNPPKRSGASETHAQSGDVTSEFRKLVDVKISRSMYFHDQNIFSYYRI
jgi:hypothetical protein